MSLNALAPFRDVAVTATSRSANPNTRTTAADGDAGTAFADRDSTICCSAATNSGSPIRGFIDCGLNQRPFAFVRYNGRCRLSQEVDRRMSGVRFARHQPIDRQRKRHDVTSPTDQLAPNQGEDIGRVKVFTFQHTGSYRPQPVANAQLAEVARWKDDRICIEIFGRSNPGPRLRSRMELAARSLRPFAAKPIDRLGYTRLIHHQHAQCYTCPRRRGRRWLWTFARAAGDNHNCGYREAVKTRRHGDKETRRRGDDRFSLSPPLLVYLSSTWIHTTITSGSTAAK